MTSSIAAIHVAKKQLGLDDDTYRAKLTNITGKASAKDMSEAERQKVLTVFRSEGFAPAPAARRPDGRQKLTGSFAKKLQALWIAGWNLGVVENRDDAALLAFVKRQTGLDHVRFLHHAEDGRAAIEALKAWLHREAGVDWTVYQLGSPWRNLPGFKIAEAQWRILVPQSPRDFWGVVTDMIGQPDTYRDLTDAEWITVMNKFGESIRTDKRVRKARKTGAK